MRAQEKRLLRRCGRRSALLCIAAASAPLIACGEQAPQPASPLPSSAASPSPTPSPALPSLPPTDGAAPTVAPSGASPVTYAIPGGYVLTIATDQEIRLASSAGSELLAFVVDPSAEDTSHPVATTDVGGETGFVIKRGANSEGVYSEVIVVRHAGAQYEISCTGYRGYDAGTLQRGCSSFVGSLRFRA